MWKWTLLFSCVAVITGRADVTLVDHSQQRFLVLWEDAKQVHGKSCRSLSSEFDSARECDGVEMNTEEIEPWFKLNWKANGFGLGARLMERTMEIEELEKKLRSETVVSGSEIQRQIDELKKARDNAMKIERLHKAFAERENLKLDLDLINEDPLLSVSYRVFKKLADAAGAGIPKFDLSFDFAVTEIPGIRMQKNEATVHTWSSVMGFNPKSTENSSENSLSKPWRVADQPVTNLNAKQMEDFIVKLNSFVQGKPYRYRLPSLHEFYETATISSRYASNDELRRAKIGGQDPTYRSIRFSEPNHLGLYDMLWNVSEVVTGTDGKSYFEVGRRLTTNDPLSHDPLDAASSYPKRGFRLVQEEIEGAMK